VTDCTRYDCTDYTPCPTCLAEARAAGLFPAAELAGQEHDEATAVGPRCGNNPNVRLTPGDRQAVEEFRAYLARRAAGGPPEPNPFSTREA
jgi:hypothetical protein